jgi:hypothetical protein
MPTEAGATCWYHTKGAPVPIYQLTFYLLQEPVAQRCRRSSAIMQEYATGQLFMYGGMGADGKPLNDAYLLEWDGASWLWSCIYSGHSELVPPTGAIATLMDRRLVTMASAAGSSKLDVVQSLDILQVGRQRQGSAAAMSVVCTGCAES